MLAFLVLRLPHNQEESSEHTCLQLGTIVFIIMCGNMHDGKEQKKINHLHEIMIHFVTNKYFYIELCNIF